MAHEGLGTLHEVLGLIALKVLLICGELVVDYKDNARIFSITERERREERERERQREGEREREQKEKLRRAMCTSQEIDDERNTYIHTHTRFKNTTLRKRQACVEGFTIKKHNPKLKMRPWR